jgi:hypothetical protein
MLPYALRSGVVASIYFYDLLDSHWRYMLQPLHTPAFGRPNNKMDFLNGDMSLWGTRWLPTVYGSLYHRRRNSSDAGTPVSSERKKQRPISNNSTVTKWHDCGGAVAGGTSLRPAGKTQSPVSLKMEATCSSETSILPTRTTQNHIPEDNIYYPAYDFTMDRIMKTYSTNQRTIKVSSTVTVRDDCWGVVGRGSLRRPSWGTS